MASSLVHAFIDKENTATITTGKGRLGSTSGRQILGKTFSSNNSTLDTPRKALGHVNNTPLRTALGNVTNTAKKIHQGSLLKKIPLQSRTPAPQKKGPRIPSTPSLQFSRKKCVKASVQKVETRPFVEDYSEIEYMPDYKQKGETTSRSMFGKVNFQRYSVNLASGCQVENYLQPENIPNQIFPDWK
uniref:Uncharacterized protein LOC100374603 isoform X2 n=1 Tax=Saccoglossus kowalevskii TaxID=10224 RepID=A0ABM0N171_SACKO|nr:PREDICTED: uncharacterized protein LOC100374603 isoform X2 [Saccoglossus kowalevskii]